MRAHAIFHVDLDRAKIVTAIGHAGRGSRVGDQDCAIRTFGFGHELNNRWVNVDAVGYDLGRER